MLNLPPPPTGYKYGLDSVGRQTSVLYKITDSVQGIVPNDIMQNVKLAQDNLSMAQSGLTAITSSIPNAVSSLFTDTTGMLSSVQGMLNQIPGMSEIRDIANKLFSSGQLIDSVLSKLGALGSVLSGQLAGVVNSCKWATELAGEYVQKAWNLLQQGLSKVTAIADTLISDATNKLKQAAGNIGPTFEDTVAAVKDGSIFTALKKNLSEMVTAASILPDSLKSGLNELEDKFSNSDFVSDMKSIAESSGVTSLLDSIKDAPNIIKDGVDTLNGAINDATSAFGVATSEIKSAMTEFDNTVKGLTGVALTEFLANPENAAKKMAMDAVAGVMDSVAAAVVAPAVASLDDAINDIKAKAFAMQLATPNMSEVSTAISKTVDPSKYDKINITKAINEESQKNAKVEIKKDPILAGFPEKKADTSPTPAPTDQVYKQEVVDFYHMVQDLKKQSEDLNDIMIKENKTLLDQVATKKEVLRQVDENPGDYNESKVQQFRIELAELQEKIKQSPSNQAYIKKYLEYRTANNGYERYVLGAYMGNASRSTIPENIRAMMSMEQTYKSSKRT